MKFRYQSGLDPPDDEIEQPSPPQPQPQSQPESIPAAVPVAPVASEPQSQPSDESVASQSSTPSPPVLPTAGDNDNNTTGDNTTNGKEGEGSEKSKGGLESYLFYILAAGVGLAITGVYAYTRGQSGSSKGR